MSSSSKYRNIRTEVDGIMFDSKVEARRYQQLRLMEAAKVIHSLRIHPSLELLPKDGKLRRVCYEADFIYFDKERGCTVVEDVKGKQTETFRLKWNWVQRQYPDYKFVMIPAREV